MSTDTCSPVLACTVLAACAAACSAIAPAQGPERGDTRLLNQPAIGGDLVAFGYAEDLWVWGRDGGTARRITTHQGVESSPRFSPDGEWIAFSAQYDGNLDVYVVSSQGGEPRRLTWHPGPDVVQDFGPDGSVVLFTSPRSVHTRRHQQLFEVPIEGGHPTRLPIPHANRATYSPDGKRIAYVPLSGSFDQWKNYRGGRTSRIWLYDRADHSIEQVPQPEGRCNDTDPMWLGSSVCFLSDRNGEFNLFAYDTGTRAVRQLTRHADFPIVSASAGAGRVVYEQAGWLHVHDPAASTSTRLRIGVAADLIETRPRYVRGDRHVRDAQLSPSGARAVFECRGEIVTVPAKKGDPRNVTRSAGAHERGPVWSPDGSRIAYVSDESGEYVLHVAPQRGGAPTVFRLQGSGFYDSLSWSPDGEKIGYSDNSWSLYWLDLGSGECHHVSSEPLYGPIKTQTHDWSPDSQWIAYTRVTPTNLRQVHVYSLRDRGSRPVTDGLSDVGEPVFDASGKYLYLLASTDAGPVRQWFAMSNADMRMTHSLYVAVLQRGVPSPFLRESDEEAVGEPSAQRAELDATAAGAAADADAATATEAAVRRDGDREVRRAEPDPVRIDFEGLDQRIVAAPVKSGFMRGLRAGRAGKVFYLKGEFALGRFGATQPATLYRFDVDERKEETVAEGVADFAISADRKNLLVRTGSGSGPGPRGPGRAARPRASYAIVDAAPKADLGKGKLALDRVQFRIDPRAEWPQIFAEAWRINRDWFYDPNMHGADWPAMREKYARFLPHLAVRSDLNRVIGWMCSELAVGHHRVGGGERLHDVDTVPVGLLGADFDVEDGRYRFTKVFGGLNWSRDLRSPLTEPGVDVKAGELLLAVDGKDLRPPENLYSRFENTAERIVEITVGPSADGAGARTVRVVPTRDESSLRHRDWVEGNIRRVDAATDGRVAYVYLPNTSTSGHADFKRYFFPQAHKEAIIVDERHNGGGQIADYYVDILARPVLSWWATRYGEDFKGPLSAIAGPKVMLIDETAGSGGDLLPWMFRKMKLGTMIGRTTWGGLVGTLGFPVLMDGGRVTAPNLAFWAEDGFRVENEGVAPDVEVEQLPAEIVAGRDPQLDKAIEVVLEQLRRSPARRPERPPYPVRVRR